MRRLSLCPESGNRTSNLAPSKSDGIRRFASIGWAARGSDCDHCDGNGMAVHRTGDVDQIGEEGARSPRFTLVFALP